MLRVELDIPRPLETLFLALAVGGIALWLTWGDTQAGSKANASILPPESTTSISGGGGPDRAARSMALKSAEDEARRIRMEQAVLQRREEILRYELKLLEDEASRTGDQVSVQEAREELLTLLADERAAEERFRETLNEMWEAEGLSASLALGTPEYVRVRWPVEPTEGLSATFLDPAYERRFGIPHHAVDIPVEQGSAVRAAADGIVSKVVDNGLGYNYILVRHDDFATLYGHVNSSLVREGDEVWQGDTIALSGGRPGTPGAGALTTGPHVHFEVIVEGERIDPLRVLPDHSEVSAVAP